ncbi:MAG: hypothetical protein AAGG69_12735 [Pseudomonadota bacterium]
MPPFIFIVIAFFAAPALLLFQGAPLDGLMIEGLQQLEPESTVERLVTEEALKVIEQDQYFYLTLTVVGALVTALLTAIDPSVRSYFGKAETMVLSIALAFTSASICFIVAPTMAQVVF